MSHPRIAFLASPTPEAQEALAALQSEHGAHAPDQADVLCALGGDGFMLQTLHRHGALGKPVFGMKLGTVGFLMNHYRADGLVERIAAAEPAKLRPLEMQALTESGTSTSSLAYNEVSLLRQTRQAAMCASKSGRSVVDRDPSRATSIRSSVSAQFTNHLPSWRPEWPSRGGPGAHPPGGSDRAPGGWPPARDGAGPSDWSR